MPDVINRRKACSLIVGGTSALAFGAAFAQDTYPEHPLRMVVPQPAGGTGDVVSRIVGRRLGERLGVPIVIEDKPGAGGTLGTTVVAHAPADGYSMVMVSTGFATWSLMYPKLSFDPATDLAPVAMMGSLPFALLVPAAAPYRTVGDLVAQAKARPGMMNFASTGIGGLSHLLSGWFAAEAGISANHIPYAGSAPALSAMLGGQVDFYFDPVANSAALVKSGKLRALATTSERRSPVIPSAPTLIESGYPVRGEVWLGWMVAGATPAPIVSRLNREINAVLNEPEVRLQLEAKGLTVTPMSPQAFGAFTASEIKTWTRLARDNGIKPG